MSIYDINGNLTRVYDINGNIIKTGDSSVGYVTYPEYKTVDGSPYRLVWHDEFDDDDINMSFWNDVHFISRVTKRYQAWTDYYLSDSKLHLRLKKDAPNRYLSDGSADMAVTAIQTGQHNKLHITSPFYHDINPFWGLLTQEGYYECRFKVFKGSGTHTSWWCVGVQDGLNANKSMVEIDITEIKGKYTTQLPHGQHKNDDNDLSENYSTANVNVDFATDFHTVGFLWENGVMKWYVDGTLVDTKNLITAQYPVMHFLAAYKLRSGTSSFSGDADPALQTKDVEFQVDYLRIYKKATSQVASEVAISGYTAINIDTTTQDMTIDSERGCPICFPSYVYVNWSDGTRTEHWVKWQAVQETYQGKMNNEESFEWDGYVYGIGMEIVANINY